jgi:hypothetical protein
MNIHSKASKSFHGCFGRFAGDASEPPDFHSSEWTLVRSKKGKEKKKISKSDFRLCQWSKIPSEDINFEVAPKDSNTTHHMKENNYAFGQPSQKMLPAKGTGNKKPRIAPKPISNHQLDALLKELTLNDTTLMDSTKCNAHTIDTLQDELSRKIATTKAQEELYRILLKFEIARCRNTYWHTKSNRYSHIANNTAPLQRKMSNQIEHLMQRQECLEEMNENAKEMAKTIDKLREQRKHWDQYDQYHVNHYRHIDFNGVLHENTMQYLENYGRVHTEPISFIDSNGTIHEQEQFDNLDGKCKSSRNPTILCNYGCYNGISPRRKRPNIKRTAKYFAKRRSSYMSLCRQSKFTDKYDSNDEITKLQKELNDAINDNVSKEKQCIRLHNKIIHLQENNNVS